MMQKGAEREGVNPSTVWGNHAKPKLQQLKENACKELMRDPDCIRGRDFRDQNEAKKGQRVKLQRPKKRA